jgi:hypothetical protein
LVGAGVHIAGYADVEYARVAAHDVGVARFHWLSLAWLGG